MATIEGYIARFNDETVIAGAFREKLAPGCFARTLREYPDVTAILDHDTGRVLGRTTAGTLRLAEDATGLAFALDADPSTPSGAEAIGTVNRGDVAGCSFGFFVRDEEWIDGGRRLPLRIIHDLDMFEVTITGFPAYPTSSAVIRDANPAVARAKAKMRQRGMRV